METLYSFCQTLYRCTYLPLHYYKNGALQLALPDTGFAFDMAEYHMTELSAGEKDVTYLVTKEFNYFGLVRNPQTGQSILIGPVVSLMPSETSVRNIMKDYAIPSGILLQSRPFYLLLRHCENGYSLSRRSGNGM